MDEAVFRSESEFENALDRAFEVCKQIGVPIDLHFRRIYVHDSSGSSRCDWALSDLGWYLILLNGGVNNPHVAKAQAFALRVVMKH